MEDRLVPQRTGLLSLIRLSTGSQFVIPVYQRNYTWTVNREIKRFLEDFEHVLTGEYDKHFLGIMIHLETAQGPFSHEFSIIDGQQRLTTTFLMLYAIKSLMEQQGGMEDEIGQLEGMYFYADPYKRERKKYRLKPQVSDDGVYQQIVEGNVGQIVEKDSNVYKNYIHIRDYLAGFLGRYSIDDILLALDKLYIVCVPIAQSDHPQKIFESINATGAKLTASDLIRNFILMPIESEKQERYYETYWKKLEFYITPDSKRLEGFFRVFLAAKKRVLPNKNAVYTEFVEWFEANRRGGVERICKELVRYAGYYYCVYRQPLAEVDEGLRGAIKEFRSVSSDLPAPLFMELFSLRDVPNAEGARVNGAQISEIIRLTDIYLVRRALAGKDTSDITRLFPSLLGGVLGECASDYSDLIEIYIKLLVNKNKGNSMEMPDAARLKEAVYNANMYNLRIPVRIFFDKLETTDNPAPVDLSSLSVEHLMPQTPTAEWYKSLGVDADTYQRNLHRLGNLTLAAKRDNSKMLNRVWEYKNAVLKETAHLRMNAELLQKEKWTIADIEARTEALIQKIDALYPYFELNNSDAARVPVYLITVDCAAEGIFYEEDGSVEISEGSAFAKDGSGTYPDIDDMRQELVEEGVLEEKADSYVFRKNYIFYSRRERSTALSTTAGLLLYGSRNGWEYWKFESGKSVGTNAALRRRFSGKDL